MGLGRVLFMCAVFVLTAAQTNDTIPETTEAVAENIVDVEKLVKNSTVPYYIKKKFPYYVSGFDYENRPIIVVEFGKWDMRGTVEKGGEELEQFSKYLEEGFVNFIELQNLRRTDEVEVDGTVMLIDLDGYNIHQVTSPTTVRYVMGLAKRLQEVQKELAYCIVINTNFVGEQLATLSRPLLGQAFEKIEIFGTNVSKWKTALRKYFPLDQLPPWYGGVKKDYTPVAVFG